RVYMNTMMGRDRSITRREAGRAISLAACAGLGPGVLSSAAARPAVEDEKAPRPVAAVITRYERDLHADVLITRILEGWRCDGGPGPARELAAMYLDQSAGGDLGRKLAARHKVPIVPTIEEAITLGTGRVAVDGVLSIGEHGEYPWNEKGQHLYPRRRFFEA